MKLSQQQLLSLAKKIIPNVELADVDNPDFDVDVATEAFVNEREPVFRKKFTDEEVPKLTTQIAGQIGAKVKTAIKKISKGQIKDSDLKDLQDDQAIQLLLDKMVDLSGKDTEQLRSQLEKVVEENNKALEDLKTDYENRLASERNKITDQQIVDQLVKLHSKYPLLKGNDIERAKALKEIAGLQYKVVLNSEKGVVELRDKNNPEAPIIKDNKVFTFDNFAEDYYKNIGLWQIDARNQQQQQRQQQQQQQQQQNGGVKSGIAADLAAALDALD